MAANFAEMYGSTIYLMHVIPLMTYYVDSIDNLGLPFDMEKDLYPKALKKVNEKLHEIAGKYIPEEHKGLLINQVGRKPSLVLLCFNTKIPSFGIYVIAFCEYVKTTNLTNTATDMMSSINIKQGLSVLLFALMLLPMGVNAQMQTKAGDMVLTAGAGLSALSV